MRNLTRVALCGLFISSLAFTACGDDDDPATDTTTGDTADTTAPDTTPDTTPDTAPETTEEVATPTEQCLGESDLAVICSGTQDPTDKAGNCGTSQSCISFAFQGKFDEFEDCTRTCMLDAERPNFTFVVSEGCTECYVDSVRCTAEECLSACASNPDSEGCQSCREEKGCTPSFFTCAGDIQTACTPAE
ncbi:MAG TPA: hypothetical protein PK095_19095 [Myxococcota bacterium]|nr:hypothetical protein [Myxococcota bacterium]